MKIFEIQWASQGEKEWICANTVIEALKFYFNLTDMDMSDLEDEDDIKEVPESEWGKMTVRNTDYDPEDKDDWEQMTFAEYMKGVTKPDIIAGTMYE